MGSIVFSTIVENIRSFFGKEEELLAQPKAVPEAASEVYEKPKLEPKKIVEKPLPKEPENLALPFTPDELRGALHKEPEREDPAKKEDLSHDDINAFESALLDVHEQPPVEKPVVRAPKPLPEKPSAPIEAPPIMPRAQGFFDEFEQFLTHSDLETEGLLDADILHKMREYHKNKQEGKEYYVYSSDVKAAIQRKMEELKTLEQEWFHTRQQLDELERGLTGIEHEIEARAKDIKHMLTQAKGKSRLEKKVERGKEFTLPDGRKLSSLMDLKIAFRTMPEDVFHHHVTLEKNDFAKWVRNALEEDEIADQLEKIRDKHQLDQYLSRMAG